jgi:hypothetical protein
MLIGKHDGDGAILVMAHDRGIPKPLILIAGTWYQTHVSPFELHEFERITDEEEQNRLLAEATQAWNRGVRIYCS